MLLWKKIQSQSYLNRLSPKGRETFFENMNHNLCIKSDSAVEGATIAMPSDEFISYSLLTKYSDSVDYKILSDINIIVLRVEEHHQNFVILIILKCT